MIQNTRSALTGVVLLALFIPARALPCSGPTCNQMFESIPPGGQAIPANAPAVGVQTALFSESSWDGGTVPLSGQLTSISLQLGDGGLVAPTSVQPVAALFAAPAGGFPEDSDGGQLRIRWGTPGQFCWGEAGIRVGAAEPLPSTPAALSLTGFTIRQVPTGNLCGGPAGTVQFAQLDLTPTAEMLPWLPLTRWELEVDGENWATTRFGSLGASMPPEGMHSVRDFHVQCVQADAGDNRLGPGLHSARVLARILGVSAPMASNTVAITFDCLTGMPVEDAGVDAGVGVDAGIDDAGIDAGAGDAGPPVGTDGGRQSDGGSTPPPADPTGCGCQGAPFSWLPLVGLLIISRRKRAHCR